MSITITVKMTNENNVNFYIEMSKLLSNLQGLSIKDM